MLVLSRKTNESIRIGDHVVITVLGCKGHTVRLGIEAPATVSIHRMEVAEKIAARSTCPDITPRPQAV